MKNKKKIIIGNWKMNSNLKNIKFFLRKFINEYPNDILYNLEIGIAVPSPFLFIAKKIVKGHCLNIFAQNVHHMDYGSYTGEISIHMLKSIDVDNIIIGHSERRKYFYENDDILLKKLNLTINNNFKKIIFCIGEEKNERDENKYLHVIKKQIENTIFKIEKNNLYKIYIAYEPIWAIGSGENANNYQIKEIYSYIRNIFNKKYDKSLSNNIRILYGGSVNIINIENILSNNNVDGVLVGNFSLKYENFTKIIDKYI